MQLFAFLDKLNDVSEESDGYLAACPAHSDSKPSLRIAYNNEAGKLALRCRAGCATGDVLKVLDLRMADLFNVTAEEGVPVKSVTKVEAGPSIEDTVALKLYLNNAAEALNADALEYARSRFGLTAERATELGLGYADRAVPSGKLSLSNTRYHDVPRLVVPFNDFTGKPHYLQARALVDGAQAKWSGPSNPKGAVWGKYGFYHGSTGWGEVVICEGPGDALTAAGVGYDTIGVRGASMASNVALWDELAAHLQGRTIIVAGDNDAPGKTFTRTLCQGLSSRGLDTKKLVLPDGINDVSDWLKKAGSAFPRAFTTAVKDAQAFGSDHIVMEQVAHELTRMFSDVFNAQSLLALIRESGGDVHYTDESGMVVYRPERGVWELDATDWVRSRAQNVASRIQAEVLRKMEGLDARIAGLSHKDNVTEMGKVVDAQRRKARQGTLVSYVQSTRGIDSMIRELRALDGVPARLSDFDQHPHLLACTNGVVNLQTGELKPFSEETKALRLLRMVSVPYVSGARNPRWESFITEICNGDTKLAEFLQRIVGYGLTGYTSEQCFGVLYGKGANGKSVFTDTLSTVLDGVSATAAFETFEEKPGGGGIRSDIARLNGARLVFTEEGKQGKRMAENTLKLLTGQGKVTTRFLYKAEFEFKPSFLILMASNYKPVFKGQDEGIWRRVKLIPFTRYFAPHERDKYLAQKFAGQHVPASAWRPGEDHGDGASGILAWCVRGAAAWSRDGLDEAEVVTQATQEYRRTSDELGPYMAEYLVRDESGKISAKDAWGAYQAWALEEDLTREDKLTRTRLIQGLQDRGAILTSPGGVQWLTGIRKRKASEHLTHAADDASVSDTPFTLGG